MKRLSEEGRLALITCLIKRNQCYCHLNNGVRCSICPTPEQISSYINKLKASWSEHEYKIRAGYDPSKQSHTTKIRNRRKGNLIVDNPIDFVRFVKSKDSIELMA